MFFWAIGLVFIIDQAAKTAVRLNMSQGESITLLPSVLSLTCVYNSGAAFGLFASRTAWLSGLTIILAVGLLLGYRRLPLARGLTRYGLALIVGGALGNLLDRLRFGYVVDFLDLHFWPVFNLADTAIVAGVCLLCWDMLAPQKVKKEMDS